MTQKTNKIFDRDLFSKLMEFVSTYRSVFYFVMVAAILLSVFWFPLDFFSSLVGIVFIYGVFCVYGIFAPSI